MSEHVTIPDALYSKESYELIGFTPAMATLLWQRFLARPADIVDGGFIDFAVDHIKQHPAADPETSQDDWNGYLKAIGINDRLRTAILMPEFEDIRYSASCQFWVLDSIVSTWEALCGRHEELRMEQRRRQHTP
ncbi:hypothetical protein SLS55_006706 [Diplodia seriata]|uniref:Uncharacterized protein n=1 Tax=Diplodia seriata TaxID=420778 RepID=A0ABR3CG18_9PEZI